MTDEELDVRVCCDEGERLPVARGVWEDTGMEMWMCNEHLAEAAKKYHEFDSIETGEVAEQ